MVGTNLSNWFIIGWWILLCVLILVLRKGQPRQTESDNADVGKWGWYYMVWADSIHDFLNMVFSQISTLQNGHALTNIEEISKEYLTNI